MVAVAAKYVSSPDRGIGGRDQLLQDRSELAREDASLGRRVGIGLTFRAQRCGLFSQRDGVLQRGFRRIYLSADQAQVRVGLLGAGERSFGLQEIRDLVRSVGDGVDAETGRQLLLGGLFALLDLIETI